MPSDKVHVKILTPGPGYFATASSTNTIALGTQTWATQSGLAYSAGALVIAVSTATSSDWVFGTVTTYTTTNLAINVTSTSGSGTFTGWNINLAGQPGALQDPGSSGVLKRTSLNVTAIAAGSDLPTMNASGVGHSAGAAPDPGAASGTSHWLREDATWATLPKAYSTAYATGTQTISNAAFTPLLFNTNREDTGTIHSTSSNTDRFTAPIAGRYSAKGQVAFVANSGGANRVLEIWVNGSLPNAGPNAWAPPSTSASVLVDITQDLNLGVGDYVQFSAYQDSGGTLATVGGGYCWGQITFLGLQ